MFKRLRQDIDCILERDPAARSRWEVITCYPGLHALVMHRIAHACWYGGFRWLGRFVSNISRFLTGIEIHPGATIGRFVFIDHGLGIVIGETAVVGEGSTIYQGVTLGGTSLTRGADADGNRSPAGHHGGDHRVAQRSRRSQARVVRTIARPRDSCLEAFVSPCSSTCATTSTAFSNATPRRVRGGKSLPATQDCMRS